MIFEILVLLIHHHALRQVNLVWYVYTTIESDKIWVASKGVQRKGEAAGRKDLLRSFHCFGIRRSEDGLGVLHRLGQLHAQAAVGHSSAASNALLTRDSWLELSRCESHLPWPQVHRNLLQIGTYGRSDPLDYLSGDNQLEASEVRGTSNCNLIGILLVSGARNFECTKKI